ncbi:MAG: hypothetical protein ABH827_02345 [bacterium]
MKTMQNSTRKLVLSLILAIASLNFTLVKPLKDAISSNQPETVKERLNWLNIIENFDCTHDVAVTVVKSLEKSHLEIANLLLDHPHFKDSFTSFNDGYYVMVSIWNAAKKGCINTLKTILRDDHIIELFINRDEGNEAKQAIELAQKNKFQSAAEYLKELIREHKKKLEKQASRPLEIK